MLSFNADPELLHTEYVTAKPFPHIVIDGLFDESALAEVERLFPNAEENDWVRFDNDHERKLGYRHGMAIPEAIELFLYRMNSYPMLQFLEKLTGINGLIPDPYFGGGGLHRIERGGFLDIHADFNWHPLLHLHRRLNLLLYLNRDWEEAWGGALELWDEKMESCQQSILPLFNRTVIFSTTDTSYHGHPKPLQSPVGVSRRSVSLYYYTAERADASAPHDTLFQETGEAKG